MRHIYFYSSAFLGGAAVMVIELAGNRVLAPWFGNTLHTWTALIGVILLSISIGYFLGGYLADKLPHGALLAHVFFAATLLTALIPLLYPQLQTVLGARYPIAGPVLATLILFAAPGLVLGMVSPMAIRFSSLLADDRHVGLSAGTIGMLSAIGSVAGTFAGGFLLIPLFRLSTIFNSTAAVLALLAVAGYVLYGRVRLGLLVLVLFSGVLFVSSFMPTPWLDASVLYDETNFYHRIRVQERADESGNPYLVLRLDTGTEGGRYVEGRGLPLRYQQYWALAKVLTPQLETAACIGGGAFRMPQKISEEFPGASVDVFELDPQIVKVGRQWFALDEYPRLEVFTGDARVQLRQREQRYDFIFGDAYKGINNVPAHLVTREFFLLLRSRLGERGVYVMNIISALEGENARLYDAAATTLATVFPSVHVFTLRPEVVERVQNMMLVALHHDVEMHSAIEAAPLEPAVKEFLHSTYQGRFDPAKHEAPVLTDEWNPVEAIVAAARR